MRSVLVTGGTGTFGAAFIDAALDAGAERVRALSRGEHRQSELRARYASDPRVGFFVGDVRDRDRLTRAMEGCDVVVHAAALKRIEVSEYDPGELVKTNVCGSVNVIEAATDAGVEKVVALSTDKACDPVNAYGASKLLVERLFLAANNARGAHGPRFSVCRYGNIWGSNGSVVPRWRQILADGERRVPVTDPECTRFFMQIEDATALVLRTIETMRGGEISIPTLPAYRLGDLAAAMGAQMSIIGLPAWEKRHESMSATQSSEDARRMSVAELRLVCEARDVLSG